MTIATSLEDACCALASHPDALVLAGGTDLMVAVNRGDLPVHHVVAIGRVTELRGWRREGDHVRLGAALTYTDLLQPDLAVLQPALAQAARSVGSPQIRNTGTLGGNVATGSPAGDTIPVLAALDAVLELRSASGTREMRLDEFVTGVKRTALEGGELIEAIRVPVLDGPQEFCKVGTRNAMVISVVSLALVVDRSGRTVRVGLGSVAPAPLRATEAEAYIGGHLDWDGGRPPSAEVVDRFTELVVGATSPIDDHRGSARYRRHAVGVLAGRALARAVGAA